MPNDDLGVKGRRWPILTQDDRAAVARVLDRGVLSGAGAPEIRGLEAEFAAAIGARFCLATNSGTAALHIALAAAGIGAGIGKASGREGGENSGVARSFKKKNI